VAVDMEASLIWTNRKGTPVGLNWTTLTPQHTLRRSICVHRWIVDEQHNLVVPDLTNDTAAGFEITDPTRYIGLYAAFNSNLRSRTAIKKSFSCYRVYYGGTKLAVKPITFCFYRSILCVKVGRLKVISKTLDLVYKSFAVIPISETCFLICGGLSRPKTSQSGSVFSSGSTQADVIVVDVDTNKIYKGPRLLKPAIFFTCQVNKSGAVFCIEDTEEYFHQYNSKSRRWKLLSIRFWNKNRGLLFVAKCTWNKHGTRLKACLLKEVLTFL
jgi:hypothetical protein